MSEIAELLENRYRLIRELAEGGFGKTFIAEDTQMPSHRRCVIKELKPFNEGSQIYELIKERFQREAVILEDLGNNSSQIPSLYAHFYTEGKFYLVQEYIEGDTLINRVQKQGKLAESAVREILIKLLPVLEYVHSKRIVHRDIKPENIILRSADDTPVLIDFGAVKETMGTVMSPSGNSTSSIIIGTPGYMPSEQMIGRPVFASDLYALGLTAIFLLTGKIPGELEVDPLTGNVAWQQYALNTSPTLAAVLDKVIQTNVSDRFITAREMLQALQGQSQPVATTIVSPPPTDLVTPAVITHQPSTLIQSTETKAESASKKVILIWSIIGAFLLVSFGFLAYVQIENQKKIQVEMARLEAGRKKAEEAREKEEQARLQKEKELKIQQQKLAEEQIKRQEAEAKRYAAEAEARRKQQTIVINDPSRFIPNQNIVANTNATISGRSGYKNIRSGPGTRYGIITNIATGARVRTLDSGYDTGGYLWYKIYDPQSNSTGWVAAQLISID